MFSFLNHVSFMEWLLHFVECKLYKHNEEIYFLWMSNNTVSVRIFVLFEVASPSAKIIHLSQSDHTYFTLHWSTYKGMVWSRALRAPHACSVIRTCDHETSAWHCLNTFVQPLTMDSYVKPAITVQETCVLLVFH